MVRYIDDHKSRFGVEPICRILPIAPAMYYEQKARAVDPSRHPARWHRDEQLTVEIARIWHKNKQVCGPYKVWEQLSWESISAAMYDGTADARTRVARRGAWQGV